MSDADERRPVRRAVARTAGEAESGIAQRVELERGHALTFDEPKDGGGDDLGPMPTEGLGAALAACTASTIHLYAARKEWDLSGLEVEVRTEYEKYRPVRFEVELRLPDGLTAEQADRVRRIAGKCPVHRTLAAATAIEIVAA